MINCPNCGGQAEESANFCVHCGNRMPAACSNCGADNRADSLFCHACGFALGVAPAPALPTAVPCPRCQASNEPRTAFCYSCGYPLGEPAAVQFRPTVPGLTVLEGVPAGFWIRLLAWCIDSVLLVALQLLLLTLLPGTSVEAYYSDDSFWTQADSIMAVVGALYYTFGVSLFSTTVGKRALGLYVLRRDGSKVSGLRAFGRHLASGLSVLLLGVGYLMIGVSSDKRGLHDHICDTVVVRR